MTEEKPKRKIVGHLAYADGRTGIIYEVDLTKLHGDHHCLLCGEKLERGLKCPNEGTPKHKVTVLSKHRHTETIDGE
jgi:hypothetical protein